MTIALLLLIQFSLLVFVYCYSENVYDPIDRAFSIHRFTSSRTNDVKNKDNMKEYSHTPVYVGIQDGLKDTDKISTLPGQPTGINFHQYSGYVNIDPDHGKTLFYYFVESPTNSSMNPLVLWLNARGCSSLGYGAMTELGPFRVNPDNKTLSHNKYAWNNVANVLFLESPAGVGFSYSNNSSDYEIGDSQTIKDTYTFLVNWLTRFQEYKNRDFYIAGQNDAAIYIPHLAQLILQNNKINNQTEINLKGIILGNAYLDEETSWKGYYDYVWSHGIISDELYHGIISNCNFSENATLSWRCKDYQKKVVKARGQINIYDIYGFSCPPPNNSSFQTSGFDPCTIFYVAEYLNNTEVQQSLHAKSTGWFQCSGVVLNNWKDSPYTVLPIVRDVMSSGIRVWIYSGDTDAFYSVLQSRYDIQKLQTSVKTPWYPWMYEGEVGGYAQEYQNLTFVTIRGAGHSVPSNQPARSLVVFTSFIQGKLP